jgi:hypothetical protein
LQEVGFLTEKKKKENSFMYAEQKLSYICWINFESILFWQACKI